MKKLLSEFVLEKDDLESEDSGVVKLFRFDFNDKSTGMSHGQVVSCDEENWKNPKHDFMDSLVGKKIRIILEVTDA